MEVKSFIVLAQSRKEVEQAFISKAFKKDFHNNIFLLEYCIKLVNY